MVRINKKKTLCFWTFENNVDYSVWFEIKRLKILFVLWFDIIGQIIQQLFCACGLVMLIVFKILGFSGYFLYFNICMYTYTCTYVYTVWICYLKFICYFTAIKSVLLNQEILIFLKIIGPEISELFVWTLVKRFWNFCVYINIRDIF